MKNIEIRISEEAGCFINYRDHDYHIGDPEKISLAKSLNAGKKDLTLMYEGPNIPEEAKQSLSEFASDAGLKLEIMSREFTALPNYRDTWSAEIPDNFEVHIKYTSQL